METVAIVLGVIVGLLIVGFLVWLIIGLAGASGDVVAIAEHFDSFCAKITDWFTNFFDTLGDAITDVFAWIVNVWDGLVVFFDTVFSFLG